MKKKEQTDKKQLDTESPEQAGALFSELDLPLWSVISFDGCIASGLTYEQAVAEMSKQSGNKTPGLCIVTDEAAARIKPRVESVL